MTTSNTKTENYAAFMDRCEALFPHEECVRISLFYKLAKFHHRNQYRNSEFDSDGNPLRYFEHVRRTALVLMDEAMTTDPLLVSLALLHDTIEDTRLLIDEVRLVGTPYIAQSVLLMSKKPKAGFIDRLKAHGDWRVLCVKVADRIDNVRSLSASSAQFTAKQIAETTDVYVPLAELMVERAKETMNPSAERTANELRRILHKTLTAAICMSGHVATLMCSE